MITLIYSFSHGRYDNANILFLTQSGSDQLITIKPTKPGLHSLEVMWDGQQIPGSPIEIMIEMVDGRIIYELCDVLLMLMGAFTVRTPDLSNLQLEINQFIRIPIDCRLAGPGKLQVRLIPCN